MMGPYPHTWEPVMTNRFYDDLEDDDEVQCWHIEPDTICDWNVCRQSERLARGDYGTDPALGLPLPKLDALRARNGRPPLT